jgi:hypothetical protein
VGIEGTAPRHLKRFKGPPALLLPPLLLHVSLAEDHVIPFRDLALLRVKVVWQLGCSNRSTLAVTLAAPAAPLSPATAPAAPCCGCCCFLAALTRRCDLIIP